MNGRRSSPALLTLSFLLSLLILTFVAAPASASPISQKKERLREVQGQLSALDAKMEIAVEAYNLANDKLAQVQKQIRENQQSLRVARFNLMVARRTLRERVVALYKERTVDILDVILATKSFDEMLTQLDMLGRLGQRDAEVLDSVEKYKKEVVAKRKVLVEARVKAVKLVSERAAQKASVEKAIAQREAIVGDLKGDIHRLEVAAAEAARRAAAKVVVTDTSTGAAPHIGDGGGGRGDIVAFAATLLGRPYSWGAAGPGSFDCSGFTMYVFGHFGISLPHSSSAQYSCGSPVPSDQLQPGDLVFFYSPIHHVGLYAGGGMMIHAPHSGAVVRYESVAGHGNFVGACRPW